MSDYIKKAAAHSRLTKLASAARLIRRQRALEKYAQAAMLQKQAFLDDWSTGAKTGLSAAIGAGVGGLGGLAFGPRDRKLLSALIGAGGGAGLGAGGYQLAHWLSQPKATPAGGAPAGGTPPAAAPPVQGIVVDEAANGIYDGSIDDANRAVPPAPPAK